MVEVCLLVDGEGRYRGLTVEGHAGYDQAGRDIVCAAISAVVQTALMGLERLVPDYGSSRVDKGRVELRLKGPAVAPSPGWYIIETMLVGLRDIAGSFPERLRITSREV